MPNTRTMLLKNIKTCVIPIVLIISVFFVSAQPCLSDTEFLDFVQRAIIYYLTVPEQTELSLDEMLDIIHFYLVTEDFSTADCDKEGEQSGKTINAILSEVKTIAQLVNKPCFDVPEGECSDIKPWYCEGGILINNCQVCSCDVGTCQEDGSCAGDCPAPAPTEGYHSPSTYYMGVSLYSWDFTINGQLAELGDEVGAFNQDGTLVGSFTVRTPGIYGFMSVYGKNGEVISFRVIDKSANLEYTVQKTYEMQGVSMQFPSVEFDLGDITC